MTKGSPYSSLTLPSGQQMQTVQRQARKKPNRTWHRPYMAHFYDGLMVNSTLKFHLYRPDQCCALWLKSCSCRVMGKALAGSSKVRVAHKRSLQYSIKLLPSDRVSIASFHLDKGRTSVFLMLFCIKPTAILPAAKPPAALQDSCPSCSRCCWGAQSAMAWQEMCIQHQ